VAVSSNPPDSSLSLAEKHNLEFEVLSDSGYEISRQFGLVYELNPELETLYKKFGIDLQARHGSGRAELVITATYVVDSDGIIRYAYLEPDYTRRAEPDDIIEALERL